MGKGSLCLLSFSAWACALCYWVRHAAFPKVVIQLHFPVIFHLIRRGLTLCITLLMWVLGGGGGSGAWCNCGLVGLFFHRYVLLLQFLSFEVIELNQSLIHKSRMLRVSLRMFHLLRLCAVTTVLIWSKKTQTSIKYIALFCNYFPHAHAYLVLFQIGFVLF